jgi:hypothetical protein
LASCIRLEKDGQQNRLSENSVTDFQAECGLIAGIGGRHSTRKTPIFSLYLEAPRTRNFISQLRN